MSVRRVVQKNAKHHLSFGVNGEKGTRKKKKCSNFRRLLLFFTSLNRISILGLYTKHVTLDLTKIYHIVLMTWFFIFQATNFTKQNFFLAYFSWKANISGNSSKKNNHWTKIILRLLLKSNFFLFRLKMLCFM